MGKFDKPKKKGPKDSKPEPIAPQPAPPGKTGRGHKQKGAGTVIVGKAPMVTNDGVVLRAHERLPTQLLQEWTQREKRPAPRYKPRPPGNRHMVFVNDAKNSAYDMNFLPVQTDFESEKVAKDYAALLALEKVQGNMPLENKLPEPYCTVWKEMISTKKEKDKKDIKKAAAAKKEGGGGVVKEPAAPLPAAPPRKLPPAAKDFMFDGGDEEPEPPSPGIQVGTLDPETADWLCGSCNSQNFAKLQSGQLRTKCFKCGALKNDACELVQSTLATKKAKEKDGDREPAAVTRIQMEMTKTKRDDEKERRDKHANAGRPFRGAHTSAVQLAPRGGGGKNRQRKGAPAAVLDLQAKNNRAVEERAREEYNLLKRRRQAYFDAVKRANRPSPVAINPVLKKKLEVVLGLDTEESASASRDSLASLVEGGVEVPSTMEEYLSSVFRESRVDDEGDEDVEASYLSYEDSRVSAEQQRVGLLAIRDALVSTGFSEQQVVRAAEAVRTHGRDRLLDELDDAADSGGAAFLRIGRERSLEWLCLHLSESELPEGLDLSSKYANPGISVGNTDIRGSGGDKGNSGDSKKASTETTSSRGGNSSADASKQGLSLSAAVDAKSPGSTTEAMLVSYGWTAKDSADAASYCGGDPASGENIGAIAASAAVLCNATISTLGDTQCTPVTFSRSEAIGDTEGDEGDFLVTVEEEVEVLQSIYTEENAEVLRVATASLPNGTSGSSSSDPLTVTRVTVDLKLDLSGLLKGSGKTCSAALDVFVVKPGMQYPITPPIALLRCPALAQRQLLLPVQVLLWRKAAELAGDSAVHALASWAQEELAVEAAATNNSKLLSHCPTGLKDVRACARNLFPSSNSIPAEEEDREGYGKDKQRQKTEPQQQQQQEHAPDFRSGPRGGKGKPRGKGGPFWRRLTAAETASTPHIPDSRRRAMDKMDEGRRKLPAWNSREEFLRYVQEARGVVVTGETGCGKTTQIPQFLNEVQPHAKVVVCQPRRLAAVGVATRVAEERCCGLGEEVGYMVRGDSKCTARTRLAFCTYGVMLRRLLDDPFLEGIDYVILDEVHERNVDSDFGLALLAAALGNAKCRFKLILMSATISTDKFASYLGEAISGKFQPQGSNNAAGVNRNRSRRAATPAPVLEIPGFTFDVDMYYKADYEELLRGDSTTRSPLLASLREHEQQQQEEQEEQEDEEEEYSSGTTAYRTNRDSKRIGGTLVKGDIDWDLLVRLVLKLATGESQQAASNADGSVAKMFSQATGSVLVFLPGVPEINRFLTFLRKEWESGAGGKGSRVSLLTIALHGGLSAVDQKKVFVPARKGELKIVAATNVAEASITIPDVSVVVDTCKVKEMYFVPEKQMNALVTKMAPQDSLRQRRGRAGRVARGRCFRLVTVGTHDNLPANGIPEILRVSIDGLILQIKAMQAVRAARGDSKEKTALVLSRCPDPPTSSAILTSEGLLTKMQAIDADSGDITPLGKHLAALPCEPRVGRLLVYGALLGCAFPAAVVAAMLSCQSPFLNSSDPVKREEGNAAKAEFMSQSGYKSDQLAVVAAMRQWAACRGQGERRRFAVSHYLSHDRLGDIDKLAREFLGDLASLGLVVDPVAAAHLSSEGRDNVDNCNSNKPKIVAAALCAGLYPQVSRILRPPKRFEGVLGSNFEKDVDGKEIRFYVPEAVVEQPEDVGDKEEDADGKEEEEDDDVRPVRRRTRLRVHSSDEEDEDQGEDEDEGGGKGQMKLAAPIAGNSNKSEIDMEGMFRVFIHPSSVNFSNTIFGHSRYLLYGEISVSMNPGQGFKAYLRDTTEAATYPLLFFGGKLEAQYLQGTITIDNWIKFVASGKQVALIQATRRAFDAILTEKIENPSINHHDNDVVKAVCDLLNSNSNA